MRAASWSLGFGLCCWVLGCAGHRPVPGAAPTIGEDAVTASVPAPNVEVGASAPTVDGAESDRGPPAETPPAVDPAVARALVAKSGETGASNSLSLRFEVIELGSELPWAFAVVNRGTEAALVDFDARLLSLEIKPPVPADTPDARRSAPKAVKPVKLVKCRLPADILPGSVDAALSIKLEPGEGVAQNFDPRLYCVGQTPWPLLEGAEVSARFGFAPKMKVTWHAGKREEVPALQVEPFVAEPVEARGSLPGAESDAPSERRVKELLGTPFTLGSNFSNSTGEPRERVKAPLGLELTLAGSDAANEGSATATITITNRGMKKSDVYFRRELITYEVSGPDGVFQCDAQPDQRSPADRSAVQTLRPGGKLSAVSRLIEMCPAHTFARPGLYLVHARFDAADPATALGYNAFMGRLVSSKPALVRIRRGELPFTPASGLVHVHVGQ